MLLALDLSTTAVGWALFDANRYHSSGTFKPTGGIAAERIVRVGFWLMRRPWGVVTDVAAEVPAGQHGNPDTDRKLGGVFYVAMFVARMNGSRWHEVRPAQVKATGVHKGALSAAAEYVRDATDDAYTRVDPDEADAIGVALAWLKEGRRWEG